MNLAETLALCQRQRVLLYNEIQKAYEHLQEDYAQQKIELIEYKTQAHYWSSQFSALKLREVGLVQENEALKAALYNVA